MFSLIKWMLISIALIFLSYLFFPEYVKSAFEYISELLFQNKDTILEKIEVLKNSAVKVYDIFLGVVNFIKGLFG